MAKTEIILQPMSEFAYNADINGYYAKFTNGLMIVTGKITQLSFNNQTMIEGEVDLPVEFTNAVYATVGSGSATSNNAYLFRAAVSPGTHSKIQWSLGSGTGEPITVNNRQLTWIAVGRWK